MGCEYISPAEARRSELSGQTDGGLTDADSALPETSAEGSAPAGTCRFEKASVAATSTYGAPTALVRVSTSDGKVWASLLGATDRIMFNAVDETGALVFTADRVLDQASSGQMFGMPRLAVSASRLLVGYGRYRADTGEFSTSMRELAPLTGSWVGEEALGPTTSSASLPRVTGAATTGDGSRILLSTIEGGGDLDPMRAELFGARPSLLRVDTGLPAARGAAVAWAPAAERFGVAELTANGGLIQTFDAELTPGNSYSFATPWIDPPWGSSIAPPAVVGVGGRFYVLWIREDGDEKAVKLNGFDALAGTPVSADAPVVSSVPATQGGHPAYPRLAFDGQSLIAAWVQADADITGHVHARRYDLDLNALGDEMCITCGAPKAAESEFSLATDGAGRFAVGFYALYDSRHYIVGIDCTGP